MPGIADRGQVCAHLCRRAKGGHAGITLIPISIEDFDGELLVKINAIELLCDELSRKRTIGTVGAGAMQDPYTPSEARLNMTGHALQVIAGMGFPVHITTKSDLILKDLDTLVEINKVHASVAFTVTTAYVQALD